MLGHLLETTARSLLERAGVHINGARPWDVRVHNERFYRSVLFRGSLGLGESYMNGDWDCENVDELVHRILSTDLDVPSWCALPARVRAVSRRAKASLRNLQSRRGSTFLAEYHYERDPALFEAFLDPYNQYTCGYFDETDDLNRAQRKKLELICRKLQLQPSDRVLDIGCGWGGFARYAAENYGVHVTGVTISRAQARYARKFTEGLPVEIIERDYRDLGGDSALEGFDRVLVCGMIEHVGRKNYRRLMRVVHDSLSDDGLFLLHTIGRNTPARVTDPWIAKYIFPNSMIPSLSQLAAAHEGLLILHDLHDFAHCYDNTLLAWHRRFNDNWDSIRSTRERPTPYDGRFRRMWNYYLLASAGAFRARKLQLWQFVFSKHGIAGAYVPVRTVREPEAEESAVG
ncbi:MAG: cyclopropane fatty acyl phospholipid synthase [Gemmatimonadota bacterium]